MVCKIAEARKKKGWTQKRLADESKVSRAIISGLESGRLTVTTTATLTKIANALGKKVGDLFFDNKV